VEKNLESGMTEAKIALCENCNATVTGIEPDDSTTRVITIIEATDELDGNAVISTNAILGGGNDRRLKRGTEVASLADNETADGAGLSLPGEMIRWNPLEPPKPKPIKRDADEGVVGEQTDMTQAIMEERADYDADEEFRAANGHGYDARRTRPVNNYRGYGNQARFADDSDERRLENEDAVDDDDDDGGGGDHNSHYEYVPMEFDDEGNHR